MNHAFFRLGRIWATLLICLALFIPWTLDIRKVEGRSMEPAYHPGRIVVSWRWAYGLPKPLSGGYLFRWALPQPGDVVVFRAPPGDHYALKRVGSLLFGEKEQVNLFGDNSSVSRDSRDFGPLPVEEVLGKVIF